MISYAFKIVSIDPSWSEPIEVYRRMDAIDKFMTSLQDKGKKLCNDYIKKPKRAACFNGRREKST